MKETSSPKKTKTPIKEKANEEAFVKTTISKVKPDDTTFTYKYVLSTPEQKKAIDLTKYSKKLEEIIKAFFTTELVSVEVRSDSYSLILNESFKVGDKRRLGRLISQNSGLKQYVRTISYNNSKDTSGQLFKLKNPDTDKPAKKDEKVAV